MHVLAKLASWVEANCDGDWEHQFGVRICTIDNPGWLVKVDLSGTALAGRILPLQRAERTESDWIHLHSDGLIFTAAGGLGNLEEMLTEFLEWLELQSQFGDAN
jgi:hypothetical protein